MSAPTTRGRLEGLLLRKAEPGGKQRRPLAQRQAIQHAEHRDCAAHYQRQTRVPFARDVEKADHLCRVAHLRNDQPRAEHQAANQSYGGARHDWCTQK